MHANMPSLRGVESKPKASWFPPHHILVTKLQPQTGPLIRSPTEKPGVMAHADDPRTQETKPRMVQAHLLHHMFYYNINIYLSISCVSYSRL